MSIYYYIIIIYREGSATPTPTLTLTTNQSSTTINNTYPFIIHSDNIINGVEQITYLTILSVLHYNLLQEMQEYSKA